MSTTRIGDSSLIFGTTDRPWGYVRNMSVDQKPELSEAMNGSGEVVAGEFYNAKRNCSGEYIYRNGSGSPVDVVGTDTAITISEVSLDFYITSVVELWRTAEWRAVTFEGVYYPNLGS